MNRYELDPSVERYGTTLLGGSPLRLFRLTLAGSRLIDRVATGEAIASVPLLERLIDAGLLHPRPTTPGPFGAEDVTVVVPALGPPGAVPPGAIVVDDGSEPPIPATIRRATTGGPAAARNTGLAAVTTPLVAFVDVGVRLDPHWLASLLPYFADPRVALVAPRTASGRSTGNALVASYEHRHSPLDMGIQPGPIAPGTRIGYVPGTVLLARVEAIREIGGFDEALRYGEDVDLVWRLHAAGYRCRYAPSVVALHPPRPTWAEWWAQRVGYGSSAAPLAERHGRAVAPVRMSPWTAAAWGAVAIGQPAVGAGVVAGSAAASAIRLREVPIGRVARLVASGTWHAGGNLAAAVRRGWWPLLAIAALVSRRARRLLAAAWIAAGNPIRAADDLAYSVGVWKGGRAHRTIAALRPDWGIDRPPSRYRRPS